jgi:hypothetical protein
VENQQNQQNEHSSGPQARAELLPLDAQERVVSFRSGGQTYRHVFRRITQKDWDGFFTHIEAEIEQQGRTTHQMVNTDIATLWLYNAVIARADGYVVRDGRKLEELPNWQERVPQQHRLSAADLLMRVSASDSGGPVILDAEGETVVLQALWNDHGLGTQASPVAANGMAKFSGLVHRFESPTAEHRRKFLRARSRTVIVGGARQGKTMLPSAQPVLARLYDELIRGVEGYSIGGREIKANEIPLEMDGFHKVTAVGQLFQTGLREDAEEAE